MRIRNTTTAAFMLVLLLLVQQIGAARSDTPAATADEGIGYPTVSAALEALLARNDVTVSDHDGWTIVEIPASDEIWSFTPDNHPAHPAAVRRNVVSSDGEISIEMRVHCEANKVECDRLVAEFKALNEQIIESSRSRSDTGTGKWAPSEAQTTRATETLSRFTQAKDDARYRDAYAMFASATKSLLTLEQFTAYEENFRQQSGGDPVRSNPRITWYKDPPNAGAPGVYAAFDITCRYRNIESCHEVIILHEQPNGAFAVLRQERKTDSSGAN